MTSKTRAASASVLGGAVIALLSAMGCVSNDHGSVSTGTYKAVGDDAGSDGPADARRPRDAGRARDGGAPDVAIIDASLDDTVYDVVPDAYRGEVPYGPLPVKINFQRTDTVGMPAGYLADTGLMFFDRGNKYAYGWDQDISSVSRERMSPISEDQRTDTFAQMQKDINPTAFWEISVPNGLYYVHIVSGDPNFTDGMFKILVEGVMVVDGMPTDDNHWVEGSGMVTVKDGRLTVTSAPDAINNKINFIEISRMPIPDAGAIFQRDAPPEPDAAPEVDSAPAKLDSGSSPTGGTGGTGGGSTTAKKDAAAADPTVDEPVAPAPKRSSGGCAVASGDTTAGVPLLLGALLLGALTLRRRRR